MKQLILISILFFAFKSHSQVYCPGTFVYDTIYSGWIQPHDSSTFSPPYCWNDLTYFNNNEQFPSGLDVQLIITNYYGVPNSIIDTTTLLPLQTGDIFYLRQNNMNHSVVFKNIDFAGFDFELIITGTPTEYNEYHPCSYDLYGYYYIPECSNNGQYIHSSNDSCYTCEFAENQVPNLSILPNPFTTKVHINNLNADSLKYELINLFGQIIESGTVPENNELDFSTRDNGYYFVRLQSPDTSAISTQRLMKQNE